jgi:hypothetical protein
MPQRLYLGDATWKAVADGSGLDPGRSLGQLRTIPTEVEPGEWFELVVSSPKGDRAWILVAESVRATVRDAVVGGAMRLATGSRLREGAPQPFRPAPRPAAAAATVACALPRKVARARCYRSRM